MSNELDRDFFIFDTFDDSLLESVGKPLMLSATRLSPSVYSGAPERINIYVNSYGGAADVARTFLDAIMIAKKRGIQVATHVTGAAYSAGSMVAVAGSPGLRFMSPSANHLAHFGWAGADGTNPVELARATRWAQQHFDFVYNHYSTYTRIPKLRDKLKDDSLFITYDEARRWGLCDAPM